MGQTYEEIGDFYYALYSSSKKATVAFKDATFNASFTGDIVIPSTVVYNNETYTVAAIASKAFQNSTELTSIIIPESIASAGLGTYTFDGCTSLSSVTINNNSITSIPNYFFQNCSSLTGIIIPASVTSIGQYAFNGCTNLQSVNIPSGVSAIIHSIIVVALHQ